MRRPLTAPSSTARCGIGPYYSPSNVQKFFRLLSSQRREPELRVIRLLPPLMPILRAVVGQEQKLGAGHTLTEHIQKALRLPVDPVQSSKIRISG